MVIHVFQVTKFDIDQFAGRPWREITEACPDRVKQTTYRSYDVIQQRRETWVAPKTEDFLPLDCAWLREIDGRAFLYAQNW